MCEFDPKLLDLSTSVHAMFGWYVVMCGPPGRMTIPNQKRLDRRSIRLERLGLISTKRVGKGFEVEITDLGVELATVLRLSGNLSPGGDHEDD